MVDADKLYSIHPIDLQAGLTGTCNQTLLFIPSLELKLIIFAA